MDQSRQTEELRQTFEQRYQEGEIPWDTGITPPELVELVEKTDLPPGRALDLGCGTGTNCIYLARHGWQAVGVDFSALAVEQAQHKARQDGLADAVCQFHQADVTDLGFLSGPFDLALDIGCLSSVPPDRWRTYASEVARLVPPGGTYLLYAHTEGITPTQVHRLFATAFVLERQENGLDTRRPGWQSSWYWMRRIES